MTDRELLELAAKAAGVELTWDCTDRFGEPWTVIKGVVCAYWNPLTDDGDAVRLLVACSLDISFQEDGVYASGFDVQNHQLFEWHNDESAATRRAIVRAAAEIGRNMK